MCVLHVSVRPGRGTEFDRFWLVGGVRGHRTWPRLSFAGCAECVRILITGCLVQLNMKPASLLDLP